MTKYPRMTKYPSVLDYFEFAGGKASLEARGGFEPPHKGFADLSLTTWVPRRPKTLPLRGAREFWSGRRDLNPRLRPWQGRTLPLSYSRSFTTIIAAFLEPSKAAPGAVSH